jgi:thymidylate synthase (FAD)
MELKESVLDLGFIEVIDHLGNDLTVANSARVSFGKRKKTYDKSDERLVRYLAKHKHFSPFRHLVVQFHIKAPEFVTRQLYKHVVGIETTSSSITKDHAWNEVSQRYLPVGEFYTPEIWRQQSEDSKQASVGAISSQEETREDLYWG